MDPEVSGAGIETDVDTVGFEGGLTEAGAGVGPESATEEVAGAGECVGITEESEAVTVLAELGATDPAAVEVDADAGARVVGALVVAVVEAAEARLR